jgi:hypothetical protein
MMSAPKAHHHQGGSNMAKGQDRKKEKKKPKAPKPTK